jgi:hypothetical protein
LVGWLLVKVLGCHIKTLLRQRINGFSIKRWKAQAMAMVVIKRTNEPIMFEKKKCVRVKITNLINNERTETWSR